MDLLAQDLGIDRVELRLKNYIHSDEFPYQTPSGSVYDSGDYEGAMERLLKEADLRGAARRAGGARGARVGSWASDCRLPGAERHPPADPRARASRSTSAAVSSRRSVSVRWSEPRNHGQPDHLRRARGGSQRCSGPAPSGMGGVVGGATTGSRMTLMLGGALHLAAGKVRAKLRRLAAHVFEIDESDVVVEGRRYFVAGDPARARDLVELAALAYPRREAGDCAAGRDRARHCGARRVRRPEDEDAGQSYFPATRLIFIW